MATLIELRDRALAVAIGEAGVRETAPNRGKRIEQYQSAVDLDPGQPWCMAFVVWCYDQAAAALGMPSPLPRTGKVARFWRRTPTLWRGGYATVGAIYCHLADPKIAESKGHCGIVVRPIEGGTGFVGVEGNSNAKGSREGDGVMINPRSRAWVNMGFIDVGRFGPEEPPELVA